MPMGSGVITSPTENKERVETLKGANALMFGVASPAGIINFVTKRAGPRDIMAFGLAGNSFCQYGGSMDVGRRFGVEKQFGVRVNAAAPNTFPRYVPTDHAAEAIVRLDEGRMNGQIMVLDADGDRFL